MTKLFPVMLVILDVGAALVYAFDSDWRRTIYWLSAAALTSCVTF